MFYECFSDTQYPEPEWTAVVALEGLLVSILQMAAMKRLSDLTVDPGYVMALLSEVDFPPDELRSAISDVWIRRFVTHQIDSMQRWFARSGQSTPTGDGQQCSQYPALDFDRLDACVKASKSLRDNLRSSWWTSWLERSDAGQRHKERLRKKRG